MAILFSVPYEFGEIYIKSPSVNEDGSEKNDQGSHEEDRVNQEGSREESDLITKEANNSMCACATKNDMIDIFNEDNLSKIIDYFILYREDVNAYKSSLLTTTLVQKSKKKGASATYTAKVKLQVNHSAGDYCKYFRPAIIIPAALVLIISTVFLQLEILGRFAAGNQRNMLFY